MVFSNENKQNSYCIHETTDMPRYDSCLSPTQKNHPTEDKEFFFTDLCREPICCRDCDQQSHVAATSSIIDADNFTRGPRCDIMLYKMQETNSDLKALPSTQDVAFLLSVFNIYFDKMYQQSRCCW